MDRDAAYANVYALEMMERLCLRRPNEHYISADHGHDFMHIERESCMSWPVKTADGIPIVKEICL